jgi:uncharacterized membrane protein
LRKYNIVRVILNMAHIISACLWMGAIVCIGFMLYLNYDSGSVDELLAFNLGMRCLDNYLVGPSVVICLVSGFFLCLSANLRLFACRWVATKWVGTWVAAIFGALWLSPWLVKLEKLCMEHRFGVFATPLYYRVYWLDCFNILVQLALMMYLLFISIEKPCLGHKNCVSCRERFNYVADEVVEPDPEPQGKALQAPTAGDDG